MRSLIDVRQRFMQLLQLPGTAWVMLVGLLMLSVLAWYLTDRSVTVRTHERFQFQSEDIREAINQRMQQQEKVLLGGAGLFAASRSVERAEWKAYVQSLGLEKNYPGLQGYGFSQIVRPKDRAAHIRQVRAEGFPKYDIRPPGDRELYTTIVYLEPFDWRNQRAFGYDMFSEPVRRAAMERARDNDQAAISGKVTLVQETDKDVQYGFLMYIPVYRNGAPRETVGQRRDALLGFVYSPFRMRDLMRGILEARDNGIDFEIYDGPTASSDTLLYSSSGLGYLDDPGRRAEFANSTSMRFAGRTWLVYFSSRPGYVSLADRGQPLIVAAGSTLIGFLLFFIVASIARRHRDAVVIAGKMTEEVRAGSTRMASIVNTVIDGIITIDERGNVESLNPAAERIFGYAAHEVVGRNISMLMPEPYRSQHDQFLANYVSGGRAQIIGNGREVEGLHKDGSVFPLDLAVSEMHIGSERKFTGIVRDITDRKKADRLKSEFISTVSHELRTPLTSIRGSLGLIAGGVVGEIPDKAREMVSIAHKNSERLSRLINDILDIEKIESGHMKFVMQPHVVMSLIDQSIAAYRNYGDQYQVSFIVTETLPNARVQVDAERFMQIMANLLSNAAKFSPNGGQVEIAASGQQGRVRIAVTDHGPGIPNEFHDRIFQKFSQADSSDTRSKGGSGLGLSIAKTIVERMGGNIGFATDLGRGTTFYVDLPLLKREVPLPPAFATGPRANTYPCILVCEDDPDIARVMAQIFTHAGFQADLVYNAAEARSALQSRRYDVMTLDLMLPGEDGISLIRSMRTDPATSGLPIVVVSAMAEEGRARINGGFGVIDWLTKPIDVQQLTASVSRAIHAFAGSRARILHVEDDPDVRRVVASLAGNLADFEYAGTIAEARARLGLEQYGLVILDISLPDGSGWELLSFIERLDRPPPVMVFSGTAVAAEQARQVASALVKASTSNDDIIKTIRALLRPDSRQNT